MTMRTLSFSTALMVASLVSAMAQTTAPGAGTSAQGGLADYWWIIPVVLIAAVGIWYFMKGRNRV